LDQLAEITDLGLDDYLYGQGLCVIEWAEKGMTVLPSEHLLVKIEYVNDSERRITLTACGKRYAGLIKSLKRLGQKG